MRQGILREILANEGAAKTCRASNSLAMVRRQFSGGSSATGDWLSMTPRRLLRRAIDP
jgi:hypothetical protein